MSFYDFALVDRLVKWCDTEALLPPTLIIGLGAIESGGGEALNPDAEAHTPDEDSYGVFQGNERAHGAPGARFLGVEGAIIVANIMRGRWQSTFHAVVGSWPGWNYNPREALYRFWGPAQGAAIRYDGSLEAQRHRDLAYRGSAFADRVYIDYLKRTNSANTTVAPLLRIVADGLVEARGLIENDLVWRLAMQAEKLRDIADGKDVPVPLLPFADNPMGGSS